MHAYQLGSDTLSTESHIDSWTDKFEALRLPHTRVVRKNVQPNAKCVTTVERIWSKSTADLLFLSNSALDWLYEYPGICSKEALCLSSCLSESSQVLSWHLRTPLRTEVNQSKNVNRKKKIQTRARAENVQQRISNLFERAHSVTTCTQWSPIASYCKATDQRYSTRIMCAVEASCYCSIVVMLITGGTLGYV
jgi:hypothetical protein